MPHTKIDVPIPVLDRVPRARFSSIKVTINDCGVPTKKSRPPSRSRCPPETG